MGTLEETIHRIRAYADHGWTWDIADCGTLVVGGHDWILARAQARRCGRRVPLRAIRLTETGQEEIEP